jgi:hypothetical protein
MDIRALPDLGKCAPASPASGFRLGIILACPGQSSDPRTTRTPMPRGRTAHPRRPSGRSRSVLRQGSLPAVPRPVEAVAGRDLAGSMGGNRPTGQARRRAGPSLELFIKERPRGRGYVCDFVYREPGLPVALYGTLVNEGNGLMVNEVELWRGGVSGGWEYRDAWGDYIGPAGDRDDNGDTRPYPGITSSLLRRIPLGRIVAAAQRTLAERSWATEGIRVLPGGLLVGDDIPAETRTLLGPPSGGCPWNRCGPSCAGPGRTAPADAACAWGPGRRAAARAGRSPRRRTGWATR